MSFDKAYGQQVGWSRWTPRVSRAPNTVTPFLNYFWNPCKPSLQNVIFAFSNPNLKIIQTIAIFLMGMDVEEQDKNAD